MATCMDRARRLRVVEGVASKVTNGDVDLISTLTVQNFRPALCGGGGPLAPSLRPRRAH